MLSSSFVAYFLLLSAWSSLGLDRTDRLLINSDPQALQVQINNLIQELGKTNQEVSYLKSQLSSQHHQISSCAGMSYSIKSLIILKDLIVEICIQCKLGLHRYFEKKFMKMFSYIFYLFRNSTPIEIYQNLTGFIQFLLI